MATALTAPFAFPVRLVCPTCGTLLQPDAVCACASAMRFELWKGIPRFLFDQNSADECASDMVTQVLARMDEVSWQQALREIMPDHPVQRLLCHGGAGPDFIYSMPWDEIATVLEIGSGMGYLTARLALRGAQVVAVEPVPQRALFQRKRALQDGFPNWHPLIAGGLTLPFADQTFDLVTLSGVLESIGDRENGDPDQLQRRLLAETMRLLKPNGYLYIGARTRYSLNALRGHRDLSGLAFTSIMPRWLADWICRCVRGKRRDDEPRPIGYRTRTHTAAQYARMVRDAGFEAVETFGVQDSYLRQKAAYPLAEPRARKITRTIADPPLTRKGRFLRWLADADAWYDVLENEVVIMARKQSKPDRLAWSGLPHVGPITQFSTDNKVFALCFNDDRPNSVFIAPKNAYAMERLTREYDFLHAATQRPGPAIRHSPLRWPTPLGKVAWRGQTLYHYEYADGVRLTEPLMPVSFDADRFLALFAQVMDRYIELCAKVTAALPNRPSADDWDQFLQRLAGVKLDDPALCRRIQATCEKLRPLHAMAQVVHGDLSLSNVIAQPDGTMVLVDWENVSPVGIVALDLMRLLFDTWDELCRLNPRRLESVIIRAKAATRAALDRLDLGPADYADVAALFVAHQIELGALRNADSRGLLEAYRQRLFTLG
jgi:SAM-dependent methyltransferase/aminoglycoside phosphotransferase (APT) family kinase protein